MNNEKNIFEVATRERFRFPFKGLISVEDLWILSVKDVDSIFKTLNSELKQIEEESLLGTKTQQNEELDMKIEIIKHIVKIKLDEEQTRANAKKKKEQKQKILELIASKKDADLQTKSIEELQQMANELDN
jgi:hypothetical protein